MAYRSVGRPFPVRVTNNYARQQRSLKALHIVTVSFLDAIRQAQARPGA